MIALHSTGIRQMRRPPRAQRGQALIMAVLLMFLLVGLGGIFIATIHQTIIQTARAEDRDRLENVAQVGMNNVEEQLHRSALGADWRPGEGPDLANPGWHYASGGFYHITLTYCRYDEISALEPFLDNPLDRYMKITVEARYTLDNPPDFVDTDDPAAKLYQEGFEKGKFQPYKYLTRTITAFVPVALTDYLIWVTNLYDDGQPATLGVPVSLTSYGDDTKLHTLKVNPAAYDDDTLNSTAFATAVSTSYLSVYDGSINSNKDLLIGEARFDMTRDQVYGMVKRKDTFTVNGSVNYLTASAENRRVMVNAHDKLMSDTALSTAQSFDPVADQNVAVVIQYLQTPANNKALRRIKAPQFDSNGLDRYRALTRDSSENGAIGWGPGIYIDNPKHIQHKGDIATLQNEWYSGSGQCWEMGKTAPPSYQPTEKQMAVKIVLHDWEYRNTGSSATALPYIELMAKTPELLKEQNGTAAELNSATNLYTVKMSYPRNGVIFAEGNVVVQGNLPASAAFKLAANGEYEPKYDGAGTQMVGGSSNDGIRYYVDPTNRRFDLTIVSGGTIYIEGNLLSPSSRKDRSGRYLSSSGGQANNIVNGSQYDSKVALMATDSVCLNPTRIVETITQLDNKELNYARRAPDPECYWRTSTATTSALRFGFSTAGAIHPRTRLVVRHAGEFMNTSTAAIMQMTVNKDYPFYWNKAAGASATNLYFTTSAQLSTIYPSVYNSLLPLGPRWEWSNKQWGGDLFDTVTPVNTRAFTTFGLQSWEIGNNTHFSAANLPLLGYGRRNIFDFKAVDLLNDARGGLNYLLHAGHPTVDTGERLGQAALVTCLDLQVDALIYAQRGSWFVIPGHYWHGYAGEMPDGYTPQLKLPRPFPGFREPYDVRITVHGSIVQNNTAPAYMERAWIEHWRGSDIWYFDAKDNVTGAATPDGKPDYLDPAAIGWNNTQWQWVSSSGDDDRRMGIIYTFDATLALPVCYELDPDDPDMRYYTPRLPKLPVGAELMTTDT